jgi:hypothetical protein
LKAEGLLDRAVTLFAEKVAVGKLDDAADYVRLAAKLAGVEPATVPPDED